MSFYTVLKFDQKFSWAVDDTTEYIEGYSNWATIKENCSRKGFENIPSYLGSFTGDHAKVKKTFCGQIYAICKGLYLCSNGFICTYEISNSQTVNIAAIRLIWNQNMFKVRDFKFISKLITSKFCDHCHINQIQNGVTQKLKPLIVYRLAHRFMSDRCSQYVGALESVANGGLNRCSGWHCGH